MFRNDAKTFADDHTAREVTKESIKKGFDLLIDNEKRCMMYMPLMHSEDMEDQLLSVKLFADDQTFSKHALHHMETIQKFNRFPHRNSVLGRESTVEELTFLNN
jgi:uncharacterized protein (DUF924 family)